MINIPPLPIEKISYLEKLTQILESFNSTNDTTLLLENVFEELSSCYLSALVTHKSSLLMEKLIFHADHSWVVRFTFDLVGISWKWLLLNACASRVLDSAFKKLITDSVDIQKLKDFIDWIVQDFKSNNYLESSYASKSLKNFFEFLNSQTHYKDSKVKFRVFIVEETDVVKTAKFLHGSSFLQYLLLDSYHDYEDVKKNVNIENVRQIRDNFSKKWNSENGSFEFKKIYHTLTGGAFGSHIVDRSISRLIEILIILSPDEFLNDLIVKYFKNHLQELTVHPIANFVLQRLIEVFRSERQLLWILEEIKPIINKLILERGGIILKLAQAALKLHKIQRIIIDIIANFLSDQKDLSSSKKLKKNLYIFMLNNNNDLTQTCTLNMPNYEFSCIRSQILAELLNFEHPYPKILASGLLKFQPDMLMKACKEPLVSRVVEKFLVAQKIPMNLRQKLASLLINNDICSLSVDKNGSHIVEKCFEQADLETKIILMQKLLANEKEMLDSFYARYVLKFCRFSQFKSNFEEWKTEERRKFKAVKSFDEILSFNVRSKAHKTILSSKFSRMKKYKFACLKKQNRLKKKHGC